MGAKPCEAEAHTRADLGLRTWVVTAGYIRCDPTHLRCFGLCLLLTRATPSRRRRLFARRWMICVLAWLASALILRSSSFSGLA